MKGKIMREQVSKKCVLTKDFVCLCVWFWVGFLGVGGLVFFCCWFFLGRGWWLFFALFFVLGFFVGVGLFVCFLWVFFNFFFFPLQLVWSPRVTVRCLILTPSRCQAVSRLETSVEQRWEGVSWVLTLQRGGGWTSVTETVLCEQQDCESLRGL